MTVVEKKRRGRPIKPAVEGERIPLSLRVTAELKRDLERAAAGRSLSQEAESRLEASFDDEELFSSPRVKRWALSIAEQLHQAGTRIGRDLKQPVEADGWMDSFEAVTIAYSVVMRR